MIDSWVFWLIIVVTVVAIDCRRTARKLDRYEQEYAKQWLFTDEDVDAAYGAWLHHSDPAHYDEEGRYLWWGH